MDIALNAGWAYQKQVAEKLVDVNNRDDATIVDAVAMQYFCMKAAQDVVNKAVDMVGGAALARRLPLERYYRDVRAGDHAPHQRLRRAGAHRQARLRPAPGRGAALRVIAGMRKVLRERILRRSRFSRRKFTLEG